MPPLNLEWSFLGRPVKPVAIGLTMLALVTGTWNGLRWELAVRNGWWSYAIAAQGLVAAGFFAWGWYRNSQRWAEYGLLLVFWMFLTRTLFIIMDNGFGELDAWQALGVAVIAGGSYFLERTDPLGLTVEEHTHSVHSVKHYRKHHAAHSRRT